MARITVEDCLEYEPNRFALVKLASIRAKELLTGSSPVTVVSDNKSIVNALREIADGKVRFSENEDIPQLFLEVTKDGALESDAFNLEDVAEPRGKPAEFSGEGSEEK